MSPLPALLGSLSLVRRWSVVGAVVAVSIATAAALTPAHGADLGSASSSRIGAASVSAPVSAYAIIKTIPLPLDGRAVGVGSQVGDPIYIAAGDGSGGQLLRIDSQTLAQTGSVAVQNYPKGLAVSADDTVYVVNANSDTMSVVKGATMTVSATVPTYDEPQAVALSRTSDDTIFVSSSGFFSSIYRITSFNARTLAVDDSATLGNSASPYGLAVGVDDSVYISSFGGNKIFRYQPSTSGVTDAFTGAQGPIGVAVTDSNMIYFSNEVGDVVTRFPAGSPGSAQSVSVEDPQGIAIGSDDTIYVAGRDSFRITVIDPQSFTIDDSVTVNGRPVSIAVTRTGLVVSANSTGNQAWIVASVRPSLSLASGEAGSTGSLEIEGLPADVVMDDTTVTSVMFDGVVAPGWTRVAGTNTISGPIPSGSGTVEVTVSLNGGNTASAGNFTYVITPPTPPTPATAPRSVSAVAGDASASVSWAAPASSGSFAVSNYLVMSSPGGRICLTTALSCTVAGLSNGTAYTFTVKALTGAGWSAASDPSNAVTPEAAPETSIVITGMREGKRIEVNGSTTAMGMGAILTPWVKLADQSAFSQGVAQVLVSMDGTFEWGRNTGRKASVYLQSPDGSVRSNTVTIPAR